MKSPIAPVVMLMGTFHFANPRRDYVKSDVIDVLNQASQDYLNELTQKICKFNPNRILLEYDPADDLNINYRYAQYRKGEHQLEVNETEQLGFRFAKAVGLDRVHSFDERNTPWSSSTLFEKMKQTPEIEKLWNSYIRQFSEDEKSAHASSDLRALLKRYNSAQMDRRNKGLYLITNVIGVDDDFAGADATASWWHRNFIMFARIQKFATPGSRVLVIGGQGHTAVLRDLVDLDPTLETEDINFYL